MNKYRTIVLAYSTLDGITQDPDGRDGTPNGGWLFHHGPEVVAGDKFGLGPILKTGVTVYGRRTWQAFSQFWPGRSDDFSMALNRMPKLVVTRTLTDLSAWTNSSRMEGDVLDAIDRQAAEREVVVIGSAASARSPGRTAWTNIASAFFQPFWAPARGSSKRAWRRAPFGSPRWSRRAPLCCCATNA